MSKSSGSSFATSIAIAQKETKPEPSCPFCSCKHTLELCQQFLKKKHRDKLSFLKTKDICFGCLTTGHISRECERHLTYRVSKQAHPSVLHIDTKDNTFKEAERPSDVIGSALVELCGHIGARDQESVLCIIPVKVKAAKSSQVLQVYALLDLVSSTTFCPEAVMTHLDLKGRSDLKGISETHILLCTINQEQSVPTHVISGIEVSALDSDNFLPLPDVFTQKEMPVTTKQPKRGLLCS